MSGQLASSDLPGSDSPVLERNVFFLRYYTWIEYCIAALLILSALAFRPIIILAVPFLMVWTGIVFSEPAPQEVKAKVKKIFPGFGWLLVRRAKSHDMSLLRIPLLKVLFVPASEYRWLDTPTTRARLLHEYGHTKQYDVVVMIWLVVASIIWLRATQATLPSLVQGNLPQYEGHKDADVLHATGLYWLISFFLIAVAAVGAVASILHRRELLADAIGEQSAPGSVSGLLTSRLRLKPFMKRSKWWVRFWNRFTHPRDEKRLARLSQPMRVTSRGVAAAHGALSFLATHLIFLFLVAIPGNQPGAVATGPAIMVIFFLSIVLPCIFIFRLANSRYAQAKYIVAGIIGQVAGHCFSAGSLGFLELLVFDRADFTTMEAMLRYSASMCLAVSVSASIGLLKFKAVRRFAFANSIMAGFLGLFWFGATWWLIELQVVREADLFGRNFGWFTAVIAAFIAGSAAVIGVTLAVSTLGNVLIKRPKEGVRPLNL